MTDKPPLISIAGPTGAGKSSLAVAIAARMRGEIVNCDSVQLYRDLNAGTGKPPAEDLARARHHLVGVLGLREVYSAGRMQREGRAAVESIVRRGGLPLLVGGTGFYYRAVLLGLSEAPERVPELRERLRSVETRRGASFLFRMLQRVDPAGARRIMPGDRVRVVRALEVYFASGRPFSRFQSGGDRWLQQFHWVALGLNPERGELYGRIDRRVERMLRSGWVDEVQRLLEGGAEAGCKAFDAIGYREVIAHLQGRLTFEAMLEQIRRRTRNYARRQWTWFRKEPAIFWLRGFGDEPEVIRQALARIEAEC